MKKTLLSLTLLATSAVSATALASEWMTNWDTISSVESFGDDIHVFGLNLAPNPAACSNTSVAVVKYSLSTSEKERMALVLTSAFLAGREVKVRLHSTECQSGHPVINGLHVR